MIIKGGSGGNAKWWGDHLLSDEKNARVEVKEIRGLLSDDLHKALYEMRGVAEGSRCGPNFLYQANINPEPGEVLTEDQWREAFNTLEKNLGLEGHSRVIVEHEKNDRVHRHCIWNRVDSDTLTVANMWGNYKAHVATARELEANLDLSPTPSPAQDHAREPSPELWEHRAAERSGITREAVAEDVRECWAAADNGQAFKAALEDQGYILAKGDRRDFCIVDQAGDVHSLGRRLDGVKAAEVRAFMADVDRDALPSVAEARAEQRTIAADREQQQPGQDQTATERHNLRDEVFAPASPASSIYDRAATELHNLRDEILQPGGYAAFSPDHRATESHNLRDEVFAPESAAEPVSEAREPNAGGLKGGFAVLDAAANVMATLSDFVADLLSFGATETKRDPAAELVRHRRAAAAVRNIRDDIADGNPLNAEDVRNLSRDTLENIRAKGDDFLRLMVESIAREEQERQQRVQER